MNFGERLKKLRLENGLTQLQLAAMLGISKSNISKYESGNVEPNLDIISKTATHFNVSSDYLLGLSNNRFPDEDLEWRYPHVDNRIGNILAKYCFENNISEKTFAKQLNISDDLIKQIKMGIYLPSLKLIHEISKITGYETDYLTGAKTSTKKEMEPTEIGKKKYNTVHIESNFHFQSRFEEQCLKKGINNENVYDRLGLSKQVYMDVLQNRMPTLSELLRISYGLGVSVDYLVGKTDVPIINLSDDELELLLNYRDCVDSYKKNIRERAEKLSIASLDVPSVAEDEPLKRTGTDCLGK